MWWQIASIFLALQISTTGIALNNTNGSVLQSLTSGSEVTNSHRIIRRFTPRFKFPKPQLPTLPRPTFPFPVFDRDLPKGDDGRVVRKNKRPKPTKASQSSPKINEDRTLLAAKKAILLKKAIVAKKAIILAKLKKKAYLKKKKKLKKKGFKKAALIYGLNKAAKLKGFTVKAPVFHLSFGSPFKQGGKVAGNKEEAVTYSGGNRENSTESSNENSNENSTGEDSESEEEDDDDDDDLDEDEDSKPPSNPNNYSENNNQQATTVVPPQQIAPQQVQAQPLTAAQQQHASMMLQLQQQLQQKQQEQLNQNQQQQQQQPQLLNQQQAQAVVITPSPISVDTSEEYTSKKKAKKKAKKKKKATPRPVNLGVKANLYKKFDRLTKKATGQISSFIHIDIDFFRSGLAGGRKATDDLISPAPGRFVSRSAEIASPKSNEEYDHIAGIQIPGNFMPSWAVPDWRRQYPPRGFNRKICKEDRHGSCSLKPVYVIFKHEDV